jgi:hypothetical protein
MGKGRGIKRIGALWAMAVIVFWSLNPLGYFVQDLLQKPKSFDSSLLQDSEIKVTAHAMETCHHHPEGCPNNCFCPKVPVTAIHSGDMPLSRNLSMTVLTHCSEEIFKANLWGMVLLFPFSTWTFFPLEFSTALGNAKVSPLISRFLEPLQKVPIG